MTPSTWLQRLTPSRRDLINGVAFGIIVLIALWAFRSSYGGITFMVVGAIALVVGMVTAHLGKTLGFPLGVVGVIGVGVYVVIATWLALPHYALVRVVPSPRSVFEALVSTATAWKELITISPPVGSTGDLMIIPVFIGFASGFVAFGAVLRLRFALAAMIAPLAILALGIAVGVHTPVSILIHGAVMVCAVIGWSAWQEQIRRPLLAGGQRDVRRFGAAVIVLAVVGALGHVVGPLLPGHGQARAIWRQTITPPFDPRVYPSPLAGYRHYVKLDYRSDGTQVDPEVMFRVEGLPESVPVRLATMDSYDGLVWQVSGGDSGHPSLSDSGSFERVGTRISPDFEGEIAEVTITIRNYADVWLPTVGEVVSIRFEGSDSGPERDRQLAESFRYNRSTDTGAVPIRLRSGDRYVMTVRLPESREHLTNEPIIPKVPHLGTAVSVAAVTQPFATHDLLMKNDTGVWLDQVRDEMIAYGVYSDGDWKSNQTRSRAGHSQARLVEFAQDYPTTPFIGNAEQYASAYALVFRDLGNLPTRVVMGFIPSDASLSSAVDVVQTDIEAWVEVPIEAAGWVGIFPTPPRDQQTVSALTPQRPEPDYRTQNPPPPPLVDPEFDQPAKAEGKAEAVEEDLDERPEHIDDSPGLLASDGFKMGMAMASPFLLLVVVAGIIIALKLRRRHRRRSRGAAHDRIANGWNEVTDLSMDLGRPVPSAITRREAAAFVGGVSIELAERADASVWSGRALSDEDVTAYWDEVAVALRSLRADVSVRQRLQSWISVQSLKRRDPISTPADITPGRRRGRGSSS